MTVRVTVEPPAGGDVPQSWYFTFGMAHEHGGRYVAFRGLTWSEARARMVELFGTDWAFQYDEAGWTKPDGRTQAETYHLEELADLPDPAEVVSIDEAFAARLQEVVEYRGVLITLEDVVLLDRDGFLYGDQYLVPSSREIDGRPVYRRVDPTTFLRFTVANPTERSTR